MKRIKVSYMTYNEMEVLINESLAEDLNSEDENTFNLAVEEVWDRVQGADCDAAGTDWENCLCRIEDMDDFDTLIEF